MNRENLQRIADFIPTIPQDKFDMSVFRFGLDQGPECMSIGCVIGHATVLDKENVIKNYMSCFGKLLFTEWSQEFTGLYHLSDEWGWCFSADWFDVDNTKEGARKRIIYLLDNGEAPEDFDPLDIDQEITALYAHY